MGNLEEGTWCRVIASSLSHVFVYTFLTKLISVCRGRTNGEGKRVVSCCYVNCGEERRKGRHT